MPKKLIPKEWLGAFKCGHNKNVRGFIDEEFSWKLLRRAQGGCAKAREALKFLSKFNDEYHRGSVKKGDDEAFHKEDPMRRECYSRVNEVNRDVTAIVGMDRMKSLYSEHVCAAFRYNAEDAVIDIIDAINQYPDVINKKRA